MHKSGRAAGECSLAAPLAVRVGAARCCLLRALRDGRAVGGDVLIGVVFVDADGEVDIHEFVDAVEIASREGEFFGGIGSAHHTAGEPSGLHGVVDARLTAYGMERQVLVGLVGDFDLQANEAPSVLEFLGDGDGAQVVVGNGDGGKNGLVDVLAVRGAAGRAFGPVARVARVAACGFTVLLYGVGEVFFWTW